MHLTTLRHPRDLRSAENLAACRRDREKALLDALYAERTEAEEVGDAPLAETLTQEIADQATAVFGPHTLADLPEDHRVGT